MEIVQVEIAAIDANPFRLLDKYPYVEGKLQTLQRSFDDIGIWPGVIGRRAGNRFQIAFGHHRIEAARLNKLKIVPLIVQELTDEQMLQYMGRENMEDYNADFLCMLETWEAAVKFSSTAEKSKQPIAIARLLGWTRLQASSTVIMNDTASAANAAHALIEGGYIARDDLRDMSVKAAKEIVERAQSRMEQLERLGKKTERPAREIETAKRQVGKGAKKTANEYRKGNVAARDLRGRVDTNAYAASRDVKPSPLFALFARSLADSIHKLLVDDSAAEKLEQIANAIPRMSLDEDKAALRRIDFALAEHEITTGNWRKRLAPKGRVLPFKLLKDQRQEA
jgi:ParB/Sulfiredoxin domain